MASSITPIKAHVLLDVGSKSPGEPLGTIDTTNPPVLNIPGKNLVIVDVSGGTAVVDIVSEDSLKTIEKPTKQVMDLKEMAKAQVPMTAYDGALLAEAADFDHLMSQLVKSSALHKKLRDKGDKLAIRSKI